jgi:hypothetical protein
MLFMKLAVNRQYGTAYDLRLRLSTIVVVMLSVCLIRNTASIRIASWMHCAT